MARPADTAHPYLQRQEGGFGLPSIKLLYKRLRVSQSAVLLTSRDPVTRQLASRLVKREEKLVRPVFKPSLLCREVMKDDPGASGAKRVKDYLSSEYSVARREHVESLPSHGELMRVTAYAPNIGLLLWQC